MRASLLRALMPAAVLAGCAGVPPATPVATAPRPEAPPPQQATVAQETGFTSVAAAHAALLGRRDVRHLRRDTYEVFLDDPAHVVWMFSLPGSAAYPALVRRQLVVTDTQVLMRSSVFCEADRPVCDTLQENTRLMDALFVGRLEHDPPGEGPASPGDAPGKPQRGPPRPTGVRI